MTSPRLNPENTPKKQQAESDGRVDSVAAVVLVTVFVLAITFWLSQMPA